MYPHKRTNIPISKLCQCSSGLSKTICPCRRAYGSRPATARVPMPGTSSALAAAPPPFPPPAPAPIPVPSTAPFPAVVPPTTASCGQDIAVLSKACPDCRDHDCSKCKEQIMKSPQTIFEEEVLKSCLEFIDDP